jgi:zinc transport system permease protein
MTELFAIPFMQRAMLAGCLLAVLLAVISILVVLNRLSFIGVGISHSAFGGVALGFFLGWSPTLTAIIFSTLVAWAIGWVTRRGKVAEDTAIGIFFSLTMAFGIVLVGLSSSYNVDLFGYLFGNILAISASDVLLIAVLGILILSALAIFFKEILFLSFDQELARTSGLPVDFLYYFLITAISISVVISIKVVGIILVSALLVLPGALALQWTQNWRTMILFAVGSALLAVLGGMFLSYWLNLASGATMVLFYGVLFFLSLWLRR